MHVSIVSSFLAQHHDALLAVMILSRCIVRQISSERAGDFPACGLALISPTRRQILIQREHTEIERERSSDAIVSQM